MKIYDLKNDIVWGVSSVPEYMVEIIPPPPLTKKEKLINFWLEIKSFIVDALLQTIMIGGYAYFIANIFKWVLK